MNRGSRVAPVSSKNLPVTSSTGITARWIVSSNCQARESSRTLRHKIAREISIAGSSLRLPGLLRMSTEALVSATWSAIILIRLTALLIPISGWYSRVCSATEACIREGGRGFGNED